MHKRSIALGLILCCVLFAGAAALFGRYRLHSLTKFAVRNQDESIDALSFSPDGKLLATIGEHNSRTVVRIWNVETGKLWWAIKPTNHAYPELAFSEDRGILAIGGEELVLFDVQNRMKRPLRTLTSAKAQSLLSFTPAGDLLGVAITDDAIEVRDLLRDKLRWRKESVRGVWSKGILSTHGNMVAGIYGTSGRDETVVILDMRTGEMVQTLEWPRTPILMINFSADGELVAANDFGCKIRVWNVRNGQPIHTMVCAMPFRSLMGCWAIDRDGSTLATGILTIGISGPLGSVWIWDMTTGKVREKLRWNGWWAQYHEGRTDWIADLRFCPRGKLLAIGRHETEWQGDQTAFVRILDFGER